MYVNTVPMLKIDEPPIKWKKVDNKRINVIDSA
jgi:hypothetical protein